MPDAGRVPSISVCVSSRNRAHLLPRLVKALEAQTLGHDEFEVVVADDASTDDTAEVLRRLSHTSSLDITTVGTGERAGPAAGRNRAWHTAVAPLIAFTDDDCVPSADWLALHREALQYADISQGRVEADPDQLHKTGPFSRMIGVPDENGLYETCNIAYRRDWLERLGGFDCRFRRSGEDADLAWRAKREGATTVFVSDALVYHDVEPSSWPRAMRDTLRWTGVVHLVERHPHLRPRFGRGPTWRDSHPRALLALLGVTVCVWDAGARRLPPLLLGILSTLPYAKYRFKAAPIAASRRRRLWLLGPALVVDLAELAVIVSAKARVLLGSRAPSATYSRGEEVLCASR